MSVPILYESHCHTPLCRHAVGEPIEYAEMAAQRGEVPVLITSPGIRPHVRAIVERFRPATAVLAHTEIHPRARIRTVGTL